MEAMNSGLGDAFIARPFCPGQAPGRLALNDASVDDVPDLLSRQIADVIEFLPFPDQSFNLGLKAQQTLGELDHRRRRIVFAILHGLGGHLIETFFFPVKRLTEVAEGRGDDVLFG